jgi:hypothetical protein
MITYNSANCCHGYDRTTDDDGWPVVLNGLLGLRDEVVHDRSTLFAGDVVQNSKSKQKESNFETQTFS